MNMTISRPSLTIETDIAGFCGTHFQSEICAILCPEIIAGKLLDCVKDISNWSKLQCIS